MGRSEVNKVSSSRQIGISDEPDSTFRQAPASQRKAEIIIKLMNSASPGIWTLTCSEETLRGINSTEIHLRKLSTLTVESGKSYTLSVKYAHKESVSGYMKQSTTWTRGWSFKWQGFLHPEKYTFECGFIPASSIASGGLGLLTLGIFVPTFIYIKLLSHEK